jgi:hypothetical protein
MADFASIAATRRSQLFKDKVSVAITKAAMNVLNEASNTPNHQLRMAWANSAFLAPEVWTEKMVWAVLTNGDVANAGENAPDSDIEWVVNSFIDQFSQLRIA